jgi:alanyl-tRNA synthetase
MPQTARVNEKKIKAKFKEIAGKDPEKYYPVKVLIDEGFKRWVCENCGTAFWSTEPRSVCGEPDCSGGYAFIGDSPAKNTMDFIETWKEFSHLFEKLGYTPIKRYPVAARWRDDADFVQASIYDFQPYVVSGEVEPPANPLVVPQFCLRFNDIDNVGYTGRHYTGFVMIGQHAFEPPEKYSPANYLRDIYRWLIEGMGIPKKEVQFHEDTWAGGGNMGPSMEFFSRGLEIGNQVYMQYDIRSGTPKELSIKVLDMGMGQERSAWFTHGTATSYEANFGGAIKKLYKSTGIKPNQEVVERFLPFSGSLNFDEVDNIDRIWESIASKIDIKLNVLKEEIVPLAALYSVADHTRSLLVALTDGALPSNVGGGYNIRTLLRRSLDIISTQHWDVSLYDVCSWHAAYLKPQFPELSQNLDEVQELVSIEEKKYLETKRKSKRIVSSIQGDVALDKLITLYDSQGITPQMLMDEGLQISVPTDFYAKVSERHEKSGAISKIKKEVELSLKGVEKTEILYYNDYLLLEFEATVQRILDNKYVILDRSAFYPTSGGQLHDIGNINGSNVTETFKQGNILIHLVPSPNFKVGDLVIGKIERRRRIQLAQHHTATHIINGVARELLGEHIWQAGSEKTLQKARLDITHYETLSQEKLNEIEKKANQFINKKVPVKSNIFKRDRAESLYGFRLYQGGAIPGKELRIVKIDDLDVEACGGTHLHNTEEAGVIKIIGSTKVQDGVVRLEYTAGNAAMRYIRDQIFQNAIKVLMTIIESDVLPRNNKALRNRLRQIEDKIPQVENEEGMQKNLEFVEGLDNELKGCGDIFSVQLENLGRTIQRFIQDIQGYRKNLQEIDEKKITPKVDEFEEGSGVMYNACKSIFTLWKYEKKSMEEKSKEIARKKIEDSGVDEVRGFEIMVKKIKASSRETMKIAKEFSGENRIIVVFGVEGDNKISIVAYRGKADINLGKLVGDVSKMLGGGGGGKPDFGQGTGNNLAKLNYIIEFVRKRIIESLN